MYCISSLAHVSFTINTLPYVTAAGAATAITVIGAPILASDHTVLIVSTRRPNTVGFAIFEGLTIHTRCSNVIAVVRFCSTWQHVHHHLRHRSTPLHSPQPPLSIYGLSVSIGAFSIFRVSLSPPWRHLLLLLSLLSLLLPICLTLAH